MKPLAFLLGCLAVTVAGIHAQQQQQPPPPAVPELTVRGCVMQGAGTGVYVLTNAVIEAGNITGNNLKFRLEPDNNGIELKPHLNHQVRVVGPTDGRTLPKPGETVPESELPTLRVRTLSMITNECV